MGLGAETVGRDSVQLMTPTEAALLIAALGTSIPSVGTFILTAMNKRDIKKLEINTNSIKDALIATTKIASYAEGVAEGIAKEKANPTA
jgi:5-enolpyruvylshikimate-3-phosphate synthase